jgi:hypothetical protein
MEGTITLSPPQKKKFKEICQRVVEWIYLAQDNDSRGYLVNTTGNS